MRAAIHTLLAELHFAGMAQTLDRVLDGAEQAGDPPAAVLLAHLREESRHRQERRLAYRLQQARLPWAWRISPTGCRPSRRTTCSSSGCIAIKLNLIERWLLEQYQRDAAGAAPRVTLKPAQEIRADSLRRGIPTRALPFPHHRQVALHHRQRHRRGAMSSATDLRPVAVLPPLVH